MCRACARVLGAIKSDHKVATHAWSRANHGAGRLRKRTERREHSEISKPAGRRIHAGDKREALTAGAVAATPAHSPKSQKPPQSPGAASAQTHTR